MYKQLKNPDTGEIFAIIRIADGAFIPFDSGNIDFNQAIKDIKVGALLQNCDGKLMNKTLVEAWIKSIPCLESNENA